MQEYREKGGQVTAPPSVVLSGREQVDLQQLLAALQAGETALASYDEQMAQLRCRPAVTLSHARLNPRLNSHSNAQVAQSTWPGSSQERAGTLLAQRSTVTAERMASMVAASHGTVTVTRTGSPRQTTTTGCRGWRCPIFS